MIIRKPSLGPNAPPSSTPELGALQNYNDIAFPEDALESSPIDRVSLIQFVHATAHKLNLHNVGEIIQRQLALV